ncbi:hypothetical protein RclHR1_01510010 [Rhizophagus clarus]|uniref:Protein kinase domain-containing protein n=1 Tax=Rhizophagus clarus TaxID=94130 RepID=A0A2Z6QRT7_9GLOM|nr:hypothetical protein RclHR1_01510010 [Rhizophagus clarus]
MDTSIKKLKLNEKCIKCKFKCNAILFQNNFKNWTSGNKCIDKFIQDTQLSAHDDAKEALEWIPYGRFNNIKYIEKIGVYRANWINGCIDKWDNMNKNWKRHNINMVIILKSLNNSDDFSLEFINEIKIDYKFYGITQNPQTKRYMMVLNGKCKECNYVCNAIHFQQNFENWTSGDDNIDKLIQYTQLLAHIDAKKALKWIPYDRFNNIKYIEKIGVYRANWIDGCIDKWDNMNENRKRHNINMVVVLKGLNNLDDFSLEFINEIKVDYKFYGITQNPQTKRYMMVLNGKCKECNYVCNAIHFQQNFENWTSGDDNIDKLIQYTQLLAHIDAKKALKWIPYDRFNNIKYIEKIGVYRANWIDGCIDKWDNMNENRKRHNINMVVVLKGLNNLDDFSLEFINEIKKDFELYGITQDIQAKNYMMVLNSTCDATYFKLDFENWTSDNETIYKPIQDTQLLAHVDALEWIPYKRFNNIKYIEENGVYRANWIDGCIDKWDNVNENWERHNINMVVILKNLNNSNNFSLEFINEIRKDFELCGIAQDIQAKNYMMVLNGICDATYFKLNFKNWTSSNETSFDKPIQSTQLLAHVDALEWLPYGRFNNIKYIEKIGVYRENWYIDKWDNMNKNCESHDINMVVIQKNLNNSNNFSLKFVNEIKKDFELFGITQDIQIKNYMMVLNSTCNVPYFKLNFKNWTSGNDNIDKLIQHTQLLAHIDAREALEWIPYDRFNDIKYIEKIGVYRANWIDGCIDKWDNMNKNWKRHNINMVVVLKGLNNSDDFSLEFINEIKIDYKFYGITQNPQTKSYMMVLNGKCKECNYVCNTIHFQQNFENWTSGDDNIDKLIQYTQLIAHIDAKKALKWIPYDRFNNIKYIEKIGVYRANWIDGCIDKWDNMNENRKRHNINMVVVLKYLNNLDDFSLEFINKIKKDFELYGITQDTQVKNYMMVLNYSCNAPYFKLNFKNWTRGNGNIDKLIQDTQLLVHDDAKEALEWIPYNRLNNIKYIEEIGVYRANWIDGCIGKWDNGNQNRKRYNKNMIDVILKNLNNFTLELTNEFIKYYGITQDPQTKNYMTVLSDECKKCNCICNAMHFYQNFENWTSGDNYIDMVILDTQLTTHKSYEIFNALEWIHYDRFNNIKNTGFNGIYRANWIDGNINYWNYGIQYWERFNKDMVVTLESLNDSKIITSEYINEIKKNYEFYGITQNPQTKIYMVVLSNNKYKNYYNICNAIYFQQNFKNWTSGNNDIDKFIQNIQLSGELLEWIPYNRFNNINHTEKIGIYKANWIDGFINKWDSKNQSWNRINQNMLITLESLNNQKDDALVYTNKINKERIYGITQDPQTKHYMTVLSDMCKKCNFACNAIHFQQNFKNWTSNNKYIDKFIQDTQLSAHDDAKEALEWISYNKLNNIEYIEKIGVYRANWYNCKNQSWTQVILKKLNDPKNITLEFINQINKPYGITQDLKTNNYMIVLDNKCKKCNKICNAIYFQQKFIYWTSGNSNIDKFIQDSQLSTHDNNVKEVLEWIPYNKLYNIKYIAKDMYRANWIDEYNINQYIGRNNHNMLVTLKIINNPNIITLEFINKIKNDHEFYGITQDSQTKNYMIVLNIKCKKCNYICNAIHFQLNFESWTSDNDDIDQFIQNTQLLAHKNTEEAIIEWIPYNRIDNIQYTKRIGMYKANWIDGYIVNWDKENQNWKRYNQNIFVTLKKLNNPKNIIVELANKINKPYGITQDLQTRNYIIVLSNECKICNCTCNAIYFQQNFENWTSDNNDIDNFIQNTQLLAHRYTKRKALEWIPFNRFNNIQCIKKFGTYIANWIDGYIVNWHNKNQCLERDNQNIFVILKPLDDPKVVTIEDISEIGYEFYGITQDSQTKNYMMVLNIKCKKCNQICNAIHFQQNFESWTSINDDIDKFIQDIQLSAHDDYNVYNNVLEWIPYTRFNNINHIIEREVYKANWIDGYISEWDKCDQNWKRENQNMLVILKILNDPKNIKLEYTNEINRLYGITQDPQTKHYMTVLSDICKKCNFACNAIHFQQNFENWTSSNNDIDKFIQDTQLSAHDNYNVYKNVLEWIPYNRFNNINYATERKIYKASWIDGYINERNESNDQKWKRNNKNMLVILKILNDLKNITLEFTNEINRLYGITQNPKTKNYMMVLSDVCKKCNCVCNAIYFQQNFESWASGNNDIDKFIRNTQLLAHNNVRKALEWIPYNRFEYVEYVAKGGFGKVYKASWIDGYIKNWNDKYQNWEREGQNMLVALKSLNKSKNATLKFLNEITLHYRERMDSSNIIGFYGITQDPKTENYMMVLNYAKNGSLRNYLDINYNKLSWMDKIGYLYDIAKGLESIHNNDLIHRDLHTGNILHDGCLYICDMGLCKSADHSLSVNTENNVYGVLPYIAPEILRGIDYTKASDLYSFGIIMYEIFSGLPPYHDISHDENLTRKICLGFRPIFKIKIPHLIILLIKRCIDADPINRPIAKEIADILDKWKYELFVIGTEIQKQVEEADIINESSSNIGVPLTNLGISYKTHSEAIYTKRLLNFKNLPEPKNSDDYYEQGNNIISVESSVSLSSLSLQIDVSKLNINDNNLAEPRNSNDYYEQSDNIISIESSESLSLQIDVSQSNIVNDRPKPKNFDDYYEQNDDMVNVESSVPLSLQIDLSEMNIDDNNLPEQRNFDDSYKQNDIIINSVESSESLQIDISQLNINDEKIVMTNNG